MPTQCRRDLFGYEVVEGRQVVAAFDGGEVTSDAGALLLGATDRAIGLVTRFAACFDDGRVAGLVEHSVAAMVAQRVFGIALGYEDLIDHDQLRHDPVLATLAGKLTARRKNCAPLAGKSTLNRLEHAPSATSRYHKIGHDPAAIEGLFVDLFLGSQITAPRRIILDLDATDDPLHGHQEGRFSMATTTATATCRSMCSAAGTCSRPSCAAPTSMPRRVPWPRSSGSSTRSGCAGLGSRSCCAPISGFAREALMSWCEVNGVDYLFGLARNERLVGQLADDLAAVAAESLAQGGPARRFADFVWSTLDSWSRQRRVVAKAEHLTKGSNPRFVVTSLPASAIDARGLYEDVYCARGEVENRIKERQLDLFADRTSAATMRANQLRLWFASFAYVLLDALRRIGLRHTQFATATCGTIRLKLLKIGAQVRKSVRRIKVAMASACPYQVEYHLAHLALRRAAF
jgi:Transposase DDE domain group 1